MSRSVYHSYQLRICKLKQTWDFIFPQAKCQKLRKQLTKKNAKVSVGNKECSFTIAKILNLFSYFENCYGELWKI